ncbi:IS21-like element ISAau2 family helper ATPase IstB, partial [Kitasatospora sp. NPDC017646]
MSRTSAPNTTTTTDTPTAQTGRQTTADLAFLSRAMKAPALLDAAERLAERARTESWTHLEYLVACLQR